MLTPKELREKRAELLIEAEAVIAKADTEKRQPTTEERDKFNNLMYEVNTLKIKIDRLEAELNPTGTGHSVELTTEDKATISTRVPKEGEIRLLRKDEKIADVYPPKSKEERELAELDLGKFLACAIGEKPADSDRERRALGSYLDASGSVTVPSEILGSVYDLARNKSHVVASGAPTIIMRTPKLMLPRLVTDPTGEWKVENAEATDAGPTFGGVELQARTLFFWIQISRELFSDGALIEPTIRGAIASATASEIDRCALVGTGAGEQPQGIYNDADVTQTGVSADAWDDIADSIYRIETNNHTPNAVILSPRSNNIIRKLKDGEGLYLKKPEWSPPLLPTKQILDTYGDGSNESIIITGDYRNVIIGLRDSLTIEILKEAKAQRYQIVMMGALRLDVAVLRPAAFDVITGILSAWNA